MFCNNLVSLNICYFFTIACLFSCVNTNNSEAIKTISVGKKINLMEYSVTYCGSDTNTHFEKSDFKYKIVTYANMYCELCWNNALLWKQQLKYFKEYPQVGFYCYVSATPKDFELMNANSKLNFPILLDTRERFKIVNQLGNDPSKLTFLLNSENEILIIGAPFTKEMREKYLAIICKK